MHVGTAESIYINFKGHTGYPGSFSGKDRLFLVQFRYAPESSFMWCITGDFLVVFGVTDLPSVSAISSWLPVAIGLLLHTEASFKNQVNGLFEVPVVPVFVQKYINKVHVWFLAGFWICYFQQFQSS